jgi:GNAT superfamily N-acetyltransferase
MTGNDLARVVCRPALPQDKPDVMEMARHIWDGQDYIPYVWDDWIQDPHGVLVAAELGGRVIGLGKLTRMDEGEWWLEGLRVHPELQGQGIASRLHAYLVEAWQRTGGRVLRLGTSSQRKPVHHLCALHGFRRVAALAPFAAGVLADGAHGLAALRPDEAAQAARLAQKLPAIKRGYRLMDLYWRWGEPNARRLAEMAAQGCAWRLPGGGLAVAVAEHEDEDQDERRLRIRYLACRREELTAALLALRRLAGEKGLPRAGWWAPLSAALLSALDEAGYRRDWEHALYIFEKTAPMV